MRKLTKATVTIKGTRAILFHAFREEQLQAKKKQAGTTGNNPDEWKDTVYMDKDRQLYVTAENLFALLKMGARHTKVGRGTIKDKVGATLQIPPGLYYIKNRFVPDDEEIDRDDTKPVFLHVCSVKNPATKGRNMRYRVGASPGWEIVFTMFWDESVVSKELMKGVVEDAGVLEGLLDGRSIGYGRFELVSFDISKDK